VITMIKMAEKFSPDWISHPGETIADILEEREWTQTDFAERMGQSPKHISLLLNGKAAITEETALKLESVLGSTASFWLNRESQYRESLARQDELKKLISWIPWMENFPIKELMENGLISHRRNDKNQKPLIVKELLQFFGVASPESWKSRYVGMEVAFRRTRKEQSDIYAISSWIRKGEIIAESRDGPSFDRTKFEKSLKTIRALTNLPANKFESQLRTLCIDSGVALVLIPAIPKAHVSGIARWLNPHKPLIQLSLYGKTNDRFWFTFFHEAAHILMHDKKEVFLDEFDGNRLESSEEQQADKYARDILIPPEYSPNLSSLKDKSSVRSFADKIGIHTGIVVGRLQHEEIIPHSWMNDFKVHFKFEEKVTTQEES
jgi:HTH-type transcriptional regulator / antitoxin HigA